MKSSGVLVDCSELKTQLNRLKEHHALTGSQSSGSDATGESSSSQSAIADSNSIPSVLAHLPKLDELQPITTSEVVPILASEIVVKDSVDKGFVVRGPVDHALSIQANEEQRAACEQSFQAAANCAV
ncbi:hypothetical protein RHMOL_Rhmol05G0200800 [Rhododendron molle]|uniref:Uncharacterized protein n=1 Tax=Rhododendron molle TaxID=49168 RepID=A0ACC0NTC0_RHOML|nr:hypothetical protein RHMOL_Rhmol05G0200800 [Rhododendron molle]